METMSPEYTVLGNFSGGVDIRPSDPPRLDFPGR